MQRPLLALQNRLLVSLPADEYALLAPHLAAVELERGRLLYDPGDRIETVYFPHDGVISLMTLMENGAAIESATIGREGALGLMAAVSPRQSLSRALVQVGGRARRITAPHLHRAWEQSAQIRSGQGIEQPVLHRGERSLHRGLETQPYGLGFKLSTRGA